MLAVIKNEARDNDDVANEALIAVGSYIGIYVTIASLPDIVIPLGKYLKKLKGRNNISLTEEEQALGSSERRGRRNSEALGATIINGEVSEHNLSSDEAIVQRVETEVTDTESANIRVRTSDVETNN